MQSTRTATLISRLREHLEETGLTQVALSRELGISAAALSEVMRGKNSPTCETTLHALEILSHMNDEPKTLGSAKEMLADLRAELAQLKAVPAPAASVPTPPAVATRPTPPPSSPTPKPAAQLLAASTAPLSAWEKEVARASAARLEGLSSKPLEQQTINELRIALNVEADSDRKTQIFKLIQLRKEENSLSSPRVRLRGA